MSTGSRVNQLQVNRSLAQGQKKAYYFDEDHELKPSNTGHFVAQLALPRLPVSITFSDTQPATPAKSRISAWVAAPNLSKKMQIVFGTGTLTCRALKLMKGTYLDSRCGEVHREWYINHEQVS